MSGVTVLVNPTTKRPTCFAPPAWVNRIYSGPYQNVAVVSEAWLEAERAIAGALQRQLEWSSKEREERKRRTDEEEARAIYAVYGSRLHIAPEGFKFLLTDGKITFRAPKVGEYYLWHLPPGMTPQAFHVETEWHHPTGYRMILEKISPPAPPPQPRRWLAEEVAGDSLEWQVKWKDRIYLKLTEITPGQQQC